MITKPVIFAFMLLALFAAACSSSQESQKEEETPPLIIEPKEEPDTLYIEESASEEPPPLANTLYVVQIGAYTTLERAEQFAAKSREFLSKEVIVNYNEDTELFVVQLTPVSDRQEAERLRDNLWESEDFKDAFIVTIEQ